MEIIDKFDLVKNVKYLIDKDVPLVSNLSNISRLIFDFISGTSWAGFYLVKDNYLYLGPYQGPLACTKIEIGKGVCGTSAQEKRVILVKDVSKFKGHIACSTLSKSEIVVPIIKNDQVVGVIDVDSNRLNNFNESDEKSLKEVSDIIKELF